MRWLAVVAVLAAGAAHAQGPPDPGEDEPTPTEPPPIIYVPAPAPRQVVPAKPPSGGFVFVADVDGVYRYALKESFGAAAAHFLIGGQREALRFGGILDVELGASRLGLFYSVIDLGFELSGRLGDRLRVGFAPHLGLMAISRKTNSDPSVDLSGFLIGVGLHISIDLVRFKKSALVLSGRIGYDFVDTGGLYSYANGMTAQVGIGLQL